MSLSERGIERVNNVIETILEKPKALVAKKTPRRPLRVRDQQPLTRDGLFDHAKMLAQEHELLLSGKGSKRLYQRFSENCHQLDSAYQLLGEAALNKEFLTPGAEWLLDNYHIIQLQIQDIKKHFPRGYDRTLPKLVRGPFTGYPRVYQLAIEFLIKSDAVVSAESLTSFIQGYQSETPLSIGEVWAVPIMLRFALIENLASLAGRMLMMREERKEAEALIDEIIGDETQAGTQILLELAGKLVERPDFLATGAPYLLRRLRERGRKASLTVQWLEERLREDDLEPEEVLRNEQYFLAADQISIGNSFNSLRAINYIDWKDWFESINRVQAILGNDPAGYYLRGDFKTRDSYRRQIEILAKRSGVTEFELAEKVVALATAELDNAKRDGKSALYQTKRAHIGYYLVGNGRALFEKTIQHTPSPLRSLGRTLLAHPSELYIGPVVLVTALLSYWVLQYAIDSGAGLASIITVGIISAILASEIAITVTQWTITRFLVPDQLPKLDLKRGIPSELRSVVAIQTIFSDEDSVSKTFEGLEVRYLANPERNLVYGILADFPDAESEVTDRDAKILTRAETELAKLRSLHPQGKFFILFRRRRFNAQQNRFMGWERKRGKIEEFNRLLLGKEETTFILENFDLSLLSGIRYVITLDNDSQLPREIAKKLIGTIAHPLNAALVSPTSDGKASILEGYSIIQPRMSVSLMSGNASRFAGICAGESGLDPYTQTVSELYQDLFHEGSFIGKGVYDVAAFSAALEKRVPENALLSHDLFEGNYAHTALASDVELFDDFPSRYHVHARRLHRWVRGDWQLLPWLFARVPDADRKFEHNTISGLGRWKLFDNLRRSLVAPSLFLFFVFATTVFPEPLSYWLLTFVSVILFQVYLNIAQAFFVPARSVSISNQVQGLGKDLGLTLKRAALFLCFLPHQAWLMVHAIGVTLWRVFVSKRQLLEWETASYSERRLGSDMSSYFREMLPGLVLSGLALAAILVFEPSHLALTFPIFLLWFASPAVAKTLSDPIHLAQVEMNREEREYLTRVAWSTWRYFRNNLTAEHNYLIPDNVQLTPTRVVAGRTSPTNISLSVLSTISGYDCGFLALHQAQERIQLVFETLGKLERYRGHFLNWYNTRTLDPLLPRYVSFVDSGNLVGHLIAIRSFANQGPTLPLVTGSHLLHAQRLLFEIRPLLRNVCGDQAQAIEQQIQKLSPSLSNVEYDLPRLAEILKELGAIEDDLPNAVHLAQIDESQKNAADQLLELGSELRDVTAASDILNWVELYRSTRNTLNLTTAENGELQRLLTLVDDALRKTLPHSLASIRSITQTLTNALTLLGDHTPSAQLKQALASTEELLEQSIRGFGVLAIECTNIIEGVDFTFLYDSERDLFAIGYDVGNARRDTSYYDLLASEARLGSLVAIALGQIPQEHWFSLGRPLADTPGGKALMSWGGTMFEYLMPLSMTRNYPGTILSETYQAVVKTQAAYGRRMGVPWGVSESGYSGVDFEKTYQYHAFGVPGLGLKRGLEEDLVISPYSAFMALPVNFRAAFDNIQQLQQQGARGEYGFFEAIDYTPSRLSNNEKHHLVSSFFAHHQGMSLVSLNNTLHNGILQERFHSDQLIKATELLLQEKFPDRVSIIVPATAHLYPIENAAEDGEGATIQSYTSPHTPVPYTHLLSNGRYGIMLDNAGSGWSVFERDTQLTRWREDAFNNSLGTYIYVQDLDRGNLWSVTHQPTAVEPESYECFFGPDKIEYKRRDHDIFIHTEITVSPEDNVEIRRINLTNLSSERRTLQLTSYGEVVIAPARADASHPAFSKMFVESESLSDLDGLLFHRRPRSKSEQSLFLLHMVTQRLVWDRVQGETSRVEFLGRGRSVREPIALEPGRKLTDTVGYVLDPIFSLRTKIEIDPGKTEVVTFITAVAPQRDEILSLAARYKEVHQISRAFEMAWSQSSVELRNEQTAARQWHAFQKLGNALIFNVERFRAKSDVLQRNRLAQSGLWRFGISGDFPICLVRITEPDQTKLALEALHAHQYLRARGLVFELVILNEYPGGYLQNLQEELEYLIRSNPSGAFAEKRGGVFLRTAQQLSEEEKDLLHTVARVILSGMRGPLSQQVKVEERALPPSLVSKKRLQHSPARGFSDVKSLSQYNGVGGFLPDGHGYAMAIGETLPPLPWSNVVANPTFGFLVTELGAGYTWSENCRENRVTPWSNDPVTDPFGEVVYIRDTSSGQFWCPTPGPVRSGASYRVEHQIGRSVFTGELEKIESRFELSIAPVDRTKFYRLHLKNRDSQTRKLEIFFYLDWTLGVSRDETSRYIITDFDSEAQCLTGTNFYNADFAGRVYFVGSDQNVVGYTGSRAEFLGRNRDLSAPVALDSGVRAHGGRGFQGSSIKLYGKTGCGFDPCAVVRVSVDLPAGAETTVNFFLGELMGSEKLPARVTKIREELRDPRLAKAADAVIPEPFGSLVSAVQVKTPEPTFDLLVNGWLLYQTVSARINARTGYYQSGGAFGFRDQLQDVLALLAIEPSRVREQLLLHASRQFPEGDVQHWWHPPSGKGVRTRITDDFLWLPYVTARYIESTGDTSILDEEVRFIDGPKLGEHEMETYIVPSVSSQSATLFEHCTRAIHNGLKFGQHGLPLMGGGDWNDGMNEVGREGKGESVWLGWFLGLVLKEFVPIVRGRDREDLATQYQQQVQALSEAIEAHAWDGAWYRRAYYDDGSPLGSAQNDECQIDSIAQSWSVISGMGDPERARTALLSARERLVDKELKLVKLLAPPFDKGVHHPGYIKGYLPGVRENGGQYTHAAVWLAIAHAVIGDGDTALKLFQMINPAEHTLSPSGVERYRGEPYVLCGDVYAVDPYKGRAGWSWYTGSAGWMLQAGLEYILGLKTRADHFLVEPCVPKGWKKFSLELRVKGILYRVAVENPNGVSRGVKSVVVDGVTQPEPKIPFLANGQKREVNVTVVLG